MATDYLQRVETRVELAGDAVEQTYGAPDEEQFGRYVSDARTELEAEAPQIRLLPPAAEQHPDELEQCIEVSVLVYWQPRFAEGRRDSFQVTTS